MELRHLRYFIAVAEEGSLTLAAEKRLLFDKFKRKQDQDEAAALTPELVARLVERILSHRSPKARYTVGMPGQRIVAPLKRLLPQRIFEWLFRRVIET